MFDNFKREKNYLGEIVEISKVKKNKEITTGLENLQQY